MRRITKPSINPHRYLQSRPLSSDDSLRRKPRSLARPTDRYRVWGLGFRVWGLMGFGVWGLGFRVMGLGLRVYSSGHFSGTERKQARGTDRGQGLGFRAKRTYERNQNTSHGHESIKHLTSTPDTSSPNTPTQPCRTMKANNHFTLLPQVPQLTTLNPENLYPPQSPMQTREKLQST